MGAFLVEQFDNYVDHHRLLHSHVFFYLLRNPRSTNSFNNVIIFKYLPIQLDLQKLIFSFWHLFVQFFYLCYLFEFVLSTQNLFFFDWLFLLFFLRYLKILFLNLTFNFLSFVSSRVINRELVAIFINCLESFLLKSIVDFNLFFLLIFFFLLS